MTGDDIKQAIYALSEKAFRERMPLQEVRVSMVEYTVLLRDLTAKRSQPASFDKV